MSSFTGSSNGGHENKNQEALEAEERPWQESRNDRLKLKTAKQIAAMDAQEDRWSRERKRISDRGPWSPVSCVCKIDRVVLFVRGKLNLDSLKSIPGYIPAKKFRYLPKSSRYKLALSIRGTGSIKRIEVEFSRRTWAPPYKIIVRPTPEGLQPDDLLGILELLPDYIFRSVEIAWDFPQDVEMDVEYAARHFLSGKKRLPAGYNPFHRRWGEWDEDMMIRIYATFSLSVTQLELQLQRKFFNRHNSHSIFDFRRLSDLLVPQHGWFALLDRSKVTTQLRREGFDKKKRRLILEHLNDRQDSLWEQARYLRQMGLVNVRRLCRPLHAENTVIYRALVQLLAKWPSAPPKKLELSRRVCEHT